MTKSLADLYARDIAKLLCHLAFEEYTNRLCRTISARNSTRLCTRLYSSSTHDFAYLVFDKDRPVFSNYEAARTNIDSCLQYPICLTTCLKDQVYDCGQR
jgi:hypothetical protein